MKVTQTKKTLAIMGIVMIATLGLSACEQLDTISNSEEYSTAKNIISSWTQYVSEKTSDFIENNETAQKVVDKMGEIKDNLKDQAGEIIDDQKKKLKEKLDQEVDKLKEKVKAEVKSGINNKIDESFDTI